MQHALELAVVDALDGLNNQQFLSYQHIASALDRAAHVGLPLSLMSSTSITWDAVENDAHGHDVGDQRCCARSRSAFAESCAAPISSAASAAGSS